MGLTARGNLGLQGRRSGLAVFWPLNHLAQDVCGAGVSNSPAYFVLALVFRPPLLDPPLGDSALSEVDLAEHPLETGSNHGVQDSLYLRGLRVSILPSILSRPS
jgi:hypothetical protein